MKNISPTERLNKMRQDFVANVSHELRTPLTVIHGYVDTLISLHTENSQFAEIFINMQQQTLRMRALIDDLLLLSKIENETPEAAYEIIKMDDLTASLQRDTDYLGKKHQWTWHIHPALQIRGDAHELQSAFSNLIMNAIRYTKAGNPIQIDVGFNNNHEIYFSVTDTGIGIAKQHIPRIMERFYRVDKGRSRQSGGTGLGLSIVKHVLMRHQAELQVISEIDKGSTFTCVFPKSRSQQTEITNTIKPV